jgi:transcriptional regulator with PAS, ATPase and Fis domain
MLCWANSDAIEPAPRTPHFDDAAALVELAGYPHVLAREAYALLDGAGVTERLALIARGSAEIRVLATERWDEAAVRRAVAEPQDRLQIICGVHRDESWELIAELTPSLSDRCTAIAVRQLVDTAVTLDRYRREEKQRTALWPADTFETDGGLFVSEQMSDLLSSARRVAASAITVLLTGETGTGKEVLARAIHRASPRASKPFVPFNCTAVARDMLESQLFGYRRGAFTGAENAFEGVIRAAAGGTLFLDEIGNLSPSGQAKLLRVLQTGEFERLGSSFTRKVDVRIVSATNVNLPRAIADGTFREDLFFRLNVIELQIPSIADRPDDILPLAEHFLATLAGQGGVSAAALGEPARDALLQHEWPGNVRELQNRIHRAMLVSAGATITPEHLGLTTGNVAARTRAAGLGSLPASRSAPPSVSPGAPPGSGSDATDPDRAVVQDALLKAGGVVSKAAAEMGISRQALYRRMERAGVVLERRPKILYRCPICPILTVTAPGHLRRSRRTPR